MGSDNQQIKDEYRRGDRLALFTALVRIFQPSIQIPTPGRSLGLCIGD